MKRDVLIFLLALIVVGGGIARLISPRGMLADDMEHRLFSAKERLRLVASAGLLIVLGVFLHRLGLEEERGLGGILLGIVELPVVFLVFFAIFGRISVDGGDRAD
jgi:hypothetical protein